MHNNNNNNNNNNPMVKTKGWQLNISTIKCTEASRQKQQGGQFYSQTDGSCLKIYTLGLSVQSEIKGEFRTSCQNLNDRLWDVDYKQVQASTCLRQQVSFFPTT